MKSQLRHERTFSFEFFPPKNEEGAEKLRKTWTRLAKLEPRFFSVTYGAGGSTQARTLDTVLDIHKHSGIAAAPHLSCIDSTAEQMRAILKTYMDNGLRHIVALRGDLPSGMREPGEFRYANELVAFIRRETGDHFTLEVAAYPEFHPQAPSAFKDLENFKRKVEAGADSAITQYFYSADAYFRFVDDCERMGINIPIVPGIMPITNYKQLARFSDACGAEIPRWVRKRLEAYGDDLDAIRAFGEEVVSRMCDQLLHEGSPGLHFYTMNQAGPVSAIWKNLGLTPQPE
ncbi:methylenetetrahydrofolate reductase [NAD(P)H] [Ectothiorhodospira lacustris]|uniref:methylenetetrahydrofolate reductase [NAD(P)H] n=1 Tax=Ectothiorhodospira lacustris TaxID=2899127 RepID=UPI001EE983A4|nr:methylenetetrahydrofolate reductase [NAD(P)H] [Ectothiorhodospira lacustris]MCG5500108.1 methylenetetrahydrofolate reductase [NAD(P)H] [Ectothiorhodospira lacustris]MCG5510807.1 methylenetetrahydrofolate reductase [NAD(P)H] [Ectothiorhodospira lacustris]MCG5522539.1 methylenetetrahydrofolate reductase [NAD(P)H] [Ectothiorhodospira lacustris]